MVMVTLSELFSGDELLTLLDLYREHKGDGSFATLCKERLIAPNIERINAATLQENDPMFLAYLLESTLDALRKKHQTAA